MLTNSRGEQNYRNKREHFVTEGLSVCIRYSGHTCVVTTRVKLEAELYRRYAPNKVAKGVAKPLNSWIYSVALCRENA